MSVMDKIWLLSILVFISSKQVAQGCSNSLGNAACQDKLNVANYCYLNPGIRCQCKKACNARPDCPGHTDNDNGCDCVFNAHLCDDPAQSWITTYCPTTCARRFSITCEPLVTVDGASPLFNNAPPAYPLPRYMDKVTFRCSSGYTQSSGPSQSPMLRVCKPDGSWELHPDYQTPSLVCDRVSCGSVPNAPGISTATRSTGVFEDTVTYTCPEGYNNTGPSQGLHTCNATGHWARIEDDPVCSVVTCGSPPSVNNAKASALSGVYSTSITYTCLAGYDKTGSGSGHKTCGSTGLWTAVNSDPDIICTAKPCGSSPAVAGAVPSSPSGSYRDQVTYTCLTGHAKTGGSDGKRSCTVAGTWYQQNPDPVCTIVSCGATPSLGVSSHTQPSVQSGNSGDSVTYSCITGYNQSGGGTGKRTCIEGSWDADISDSDPICLRVTCGAPPFIAGTARSLSFGYFSDNVTYTCVPTYDKVAGGTGLLVCDADGLWKVDSTNDPAPVCLGKFVKFVNSELEAQAAPSGSLTSQTARSNLRCASLCAMSAMCWGYTFSRNNGLCQMNSVASLPVITHMKKVYK